jgi:hypothetical protein
VRELLHRLEDVLARRGFPAAELSLRPIAEDPLHASRAKACDLREDGSDRRWGNMASIDENCEQARSCSQFVGSTDDQGRKGGTPSGTPEPIGLRHAVSGHHESPGGYGETMMN